MAEFTFFATEEEGFEFLKAIFDTKKYKVVPDIQYNEKIAVEFTTLSSDSDNLLKNSNGVFIWLPYYTDIQPYFFGSSNANNYILLCGTGRPTIQFIFPREFQEGGFLRLGSGNLYLPPQFLDPEKNEMIKTPNEFIKEYKFLLKKLKKMLKRVFIEGEGINRHGELVQIRRNIWVGKKSLISLQQGKARIFYRMINKEYFSGDDILL